MKYEIWKIGDETDHIITLYDLDDTMEYIHEHDYQIYSVCCVGYDRMVFEVM